MQADLISLLCSKVVWLSAAFAERLSVQLTDHFLSANRRAASHEAEVKTLVLINTDSEFDNCWQSVSRERGLKK